MTKSDTIILKYKFHFKTVDIQRSNYMIKNHYIPLDTSSILRNDALNSIKYTLLLNYEVPDITDMDNLIPEVMKCCHGNQN